MSLDLYLYNIGPWLCQSLISLMVSVDVKHQFYLLLSAAARNPLRTWRRNSDPQKIGKTPTSTRWWLEDLEIKVACVLRNYLFQQLSVSGKEPLMPRQLSENNLAARQSIQLQEPSSTSLITQLSWTSIQTHLLTN